MNRKFLVNIIFLIILNLLIKPFWFFGIEVSVQNKLGNAAYGTYFSLLSFSLIVNFLLDLGISNFNTREIAKHNQLISKYLSNIFGIRLFLGIVYLIICLLLAFIFKYSKYELFLLSFLALNQFLAAFVLYLRSNISGLLMFVTDSLLSVLDKAIMILILALLLWTPILKTKFEVEYFVWSQTIAYIITAVAAFIVVYGKVNYFKPKLNLKYLFLILRKSLPFSVLVLLMSLYNRFEPVLLKNLLPDGNIQAGIYAQGYRLLEVLSNFAYLFPVLLLPLFSKLLKERTGLNELLSLATPLMIIPAIIVSSALCVYSKSIMNALYNQPQSGTTFGFVILGFTGISLTYLFGTLLTANGNLKQLNIMAVLVVVLNLSLNLLLIPLYKSKGAAVASFTTQLCAGIAQVIMAYSYIKINLQKSWWIAMPAWLLSFLLFLFAINYFVSNWIYGIIIIGLCGLGLAFIFRLLSIKNIYKIIFRGKDDFL